MEAGNAMWRQEGQVEADSYRWKGGKQYQVSYRWKQVVWGA
jgi:hypothetical protein